MSSVETLEVYGSEMDTTPSPTFPSPLLTTEQLTVVAATFSSLVFFVVIVVMMSIIYRKDPQCYRMRSSYQASRLDMAAPPQYYSSRQTLVGSPCDQTHVTDNNIQPGQLFYVGLPSSYSLEAPMPRLPSYESVRKKDRQRQIHMMIADRFGLNGTIETEPPPSYEDSIHHSVEIPNNINLSCIDITDSQMIYTNNGLNSDTSHLVNSNTTGGVLQL